MTGRGRPGDQAGNRPAGAPPAGVGSGAFTDTARNRASLVPTPARLPGDDCLHREVTGAGGDGGERGFATERGHPVFPVRLPSNNVSLSVGELAPGAATSDHRHAYEALTYVVAGRGHTVIEGVRLDWQAGDAFYVPPWCWHQHVAHDAPVRYLTATNLPLLAQLGQTVMREERDPDGADE